MVRLAAALGARSRVISLDLLLLAGHDLRFGPPSWVEIGMDQQGRECALDSLPRLCFA
jgi:hypothetical protein